MGMKKILTFIAIITCICDCTSQKYYYRFKDYNGDLLDVYNGEVAPFGFKEMKSPKSYKAAHLIKADRPGKCQPYEFQCNEVFPFTNTGVFECKYDYQCPREYKCCKVDCFLHKVCQPFTLETESTESDVEILPSYPQSDKEKIPEGTTKLDVTNEITTITTVTPIISVLPDATNVTIETPEVTERHTEGETSTKIERTTSEITTKSFSLTNATKNLDNMNETVTASNVSPTISGTTTEVIVDTYSTSPSTQLETHMSTMYVTTERTTITIRPTISSESETIANEKTEEETSRPFTTTRFHGLTDETKVSVPTVSTTVMKMTTSSKSTTYDSEDLKNVTEETSSVGSDILATPNITASPTTENATLEFANNTNGNEVTASSGVENISTVIPESEFVSTITNIIETSTNIELTTEHTEITTNDLQTLDVTSTSEGIERIPEAKTSFPTSYNESFTTNSNANVVSQPKTPTTPVFNTTRVHDHTDETTISVSTVTSTTYDSEELKNVIEEMFSVSSEIVTPNIFTSPTMQTASSEFINNTNGNEVTASSVAENIPTVPKSEFISTTTNVIETSINKDLTTEHTEITTQTTSGLQTLDVTSTSDGIEMSPEAKMSFNTSFSESFTTSPHANVVSESNMSTIPVHSPETTLNAPVSVPTHTDITEKTIVKNEFTASSNLDKLKTTKTEEITEIIPAENLKSTSEKSQLITEVKTPNLSSNSESVTISVFTSVLPQTVTNTTSESNSNVHETSVRPDKSFESEITYLPTTKVTTLPHTVTKQVELTNNTELHSTTVVDDEDFDGGSGSGFGSGDSPISFDDMSTSTEHGLERSNANKSHNNDDDFDIDNSNEGINVDNETKDQEFPETVLVNKSQNSSSADKNKPDNKQGGLDFDIDDSNQGVIVDKAKKVPDSTGGHLVKESHKNSSAERNKPDSNEDSLDFNIDDSNEGIIIDNATKEQDSTENALVNESSLSAEKNTPDNKAGGLYFDNDDSNESVIVDTAKEGPDSTRDHLVNESHKKSSAETNKPGSKEDGLDLNIDNSNNGVIVDNAQQGPESTGDKLVKESDENSSAQKKEYDTTESGQISTQVSTATNKVPKSQETDSLSTFQELQQRESTIIPYNRENTFDIAQNLPTRKSKTKYNNNKEYDSVLRPSNIDITKERHKTNLTESDKTDVNRNISETNKNATDKNTFDDDNKDDDFMSEEGSGSGHIPLEMLKFL